MRHAYSALRLLAAVLLLRLALAPTAFADDLSVEDFFERSFEASNLPGMIAVATDGGEIVLARGYGVDGQGEPRWVASGEGADILAPETRTAMIERAQQEGSTDGFEGRGERIGKSGMQHTELSQLRISPELGLGVTVVVNDGDMSGPAFALADGALDVMDGTPIEPVGGDWWKKTAAYVTVSLLGLVLTVVGVRRARRWAEHRRTGRRWVTALRLAWLVPPALLLISLPWLALVLTMGVRTILWTQLSYLVLTPLVVLAVLAVGGLVVLVARLVALKAPNSLVSGR